MGCFSERKPRRFQPNLENMAGQRGSMLRGSKNCGPFGSQKEITKPMHPPKKKGRATLEVP